MKHIKQSLLLLSVLMAMTILCSTMAFADAKKLYPIYQEWITANVEMQNTTITSNPLNEACVNSLDVQGVKKLKTELIVKYPKSCKISWSKKGTVKNSKSNDVMKSVNTITPTKNEKIYATISNGKDKVKVEFNIKAYDLNENHINPIDMGYICVKNPTYANGVDSIVKSSSTTGFEFKDIKSTMDVNEVPPGQIQFYVYAPYGVKYKWSPKGSVTTKNQYSVNVVKLKKNQDVTCTISAGNISKKVTFKVKLDNMFSVGIDETKFEACPNKKVVVNFKFDGVDLSKIKHDVSALSSSNKVYPSQIKYTVTKKPKYDSNLGLMVSSAKFEYKPKGSGTIKVGIRDGYDYAKLFDIDVDYYSHHKVSTWKTVKERTALQYGIEEGLCSICNKTVKYEIEKLPAFINMEKEYRLSLGKQQRINVGLAKGDYISKVTVTKDGKTKVVKFTKKSNYVLVTGIAPGTVTMTVKTKAGKSATCKLIVTK